MPFRRTAKLLSRLTDKTGFTSYDDVYSIIKDNVDESGEFYEIEPAIVLQTLLNPNDFPKTTNPLGGTMADYSYLGTIKARFKESQSEGDEIPGYIKPLSPHIIVYPTKGEIVNIAEHGGQFYYYNPLNLRNNVSINRAVGERGDGLVTHQTTKYNRPILGEQGDLVLNGRFGQGIKFGSDPSYQYPDIKITNRQSVTLNKVNDDYEPHIQFLNTDGSSIFITSGPAQVINEIVPAVITNSMLDDMSGDMITLNSDKLFFNAKGESSIPSDGNIYMSANNKLNLSANEEINFELGPLGRISLGVAYEGPAGNPLIKGKQTEDLFEKLFAAMKAFCNSVSEATGVAQVASASTTMLGAITTMEDELPEILSDVVFITENQDDEIEDIADEEIQEVDTITAGAGIRG